MFAGETREAELGQRARAGECRRVAICGDLGKQRAGICWSVHAAWKLRRSSESPCGSGPCQLSMAAAAHAADLVGMAVVAGIGRAELDGQIRARNAEAMIVPPIDHHVGARRHVARGAGERRVYPLVAVMRCGRVFVGRVALQADAVAGRAQLGAMRLVAIAAGDAGREHLALLERAVVVDLVEHLPVGMIEARG